MSRKLMLSLAVAAGLASTSVLAAGVGLDVNVAGMKLDKKAEVKTEGLQNASANASAEADAGLAQAAEAQTKGNAAVDAKVGAAEGHAATIDAVTGGNAASSKLGKLTGKVKAGQAKADAASKKAADAKAQADVKAEAAVNAPAAANAAANAKVQGKINAFGLGQ